jgi:hypothetical protein
VDERLDDPDTVLEARSQLWHIDRVTHAVTVSDINVGGDGTLGVSEHDHTSLSVRFGAPPVRRVRVHAEISWDQIAEGTLDITDELLAASAAAGSPAGVVSSYTGQGLEADWPQQGDDLKGGWRGRFEDIPAAVEAVNAAFTEVVLELLPLGGGPFETDFAIAVSPLSVRRTLTL